MKMIDEIQQNKIIGKSSDNSVEGEVSGKNWKWVVECIKLF